VTDFDPKAEWAKYTETQIVSMLKHQPRIGAVGPWVQSAFSPQIERFGYGGCAVGAIIQPRHDLKTNALQYQVFAPKEYLTKISFDTLEEAMQAADDALRADGVTLFLEKAP
jgi:hypothetical protein